MTDQHNTAVMNGAQALPALIGIITWLGGKDINFWLGVAGLMFILLQAAYLIWKWRRDIRLDRERVGLTDDE